MEGSISALEAYKASHGVAGMNLLKEVAHKVEIDKLKYSQAADKLGISRIEFEKVLYEFINEDKVRALRRLRGEA